jgi:hypothetical protein
MSADAHVPPPLLAGRHTSVHLRRADRAARLT